MVAGVSPRLFEPPLSILRIRAILCLASGASHLSPICRSRSYICSVYLLPCHDNIGHGRVCYPTSLDHSSYLVALAGFILCGFSASRSHTEHNLPLLQLVFRVTPSSQGNCAMTVLSWVLSHSALGGHRSCSSVISVSSATAVFGWFVACPHELPVVGSAATANFLFWFEDRCCSRGGVLTVRAAYSSTAKEAK